MTTTNTTIQTIWHRSVKRERKHLHKLCTCCEWAYINSLGYSDCAVCYSPLVFLMALSTLFVSDINLDSVLSMSSSISSIILWTHNKNNVWFSSDYNKQHTYLFCSSSSTPISWPIWWRTPTLSPTLSSCLSCWTISICKTQAHHMICSSSTQA